MTKHDEQEMIEEAVSLLEEFRTDYDAETQPEFHERLTKAIDGLIAISPIGVDTRAGAKGGMYKVTIVDECAVQIFHVEAANRFEAARKVDKEYGEVFEDSPDCTVTIEWVVRAKPD